jgi:hypothetical protein
MPAAQVSIRQDQAVGFDMVLEPPNFLVRSDGGAVRAPAALPCPGEETARGPAASVACQAEQPQSRESATARGKFRSASNLRQEFLHHLSYLIVMTWSVKPEGVGGNQAREIMAGCRMRRTAAPGGI